MILEAMFSPWLILGILYSCFPSVTAYVTCQSNYEDAFKKKETYYCNDAEVCCSSSKKWFGCCPRDSSVLETPISIRLVLVIVGVLLAVMLLVLMCYCKCKKRRKHSAHDRERFADGRKANHDVSNSPMMPTAPPITMRDLPPAYEDIALQHPQNHHQNLFLLEQQESAVDSTFLVVCT
ncbi:uncharacterized protein LOC134817937 [Bolinopsis microptera]|uniref:uncharacterized protein LOC134817937 n=1 Tax=Bolinopsis microptera TaxID=2820187 RepID=UPI00307AA825